MPGDVVPLLVLLLCVQAVCGASQHKGCMPDPASAYRFTGAVCRLTYPAAAVLNEKTTEVIEAAFQHARYPKITGEKSILLIGTVKYGLDNLEIHNLSIGRSEFELRPPNSIGLKISNVSAVFRGTLNYGYGSWLMNIEHSIDFEIESHIDLGINPMLYCGAGKVAADTSDCYLDFHKLSLQLQGDSEPNWLKKLFTDFITFTVRLVIKGQICKEINKVANILSDFVQETAEAFLSDGSISMDIGVIAAPVITTNYIESYHKGLTNYNNISAVINESVFDPGQLTEDRMVYFWISGQSSCFVLCLGESVPPVLSVWSFSIPLLKTSPSGTSVQTEVSGMLQCGNPLTPTLYFQMVKTPPGELGMRQAHNILLMLVLFVSVLCSLVLEPELTRLLDKQGANLFDIVNPEVLPQNGFVLIQMDFGFPQHLLVQFLQKTLE
uniref:Cholesteryl ester transfer protein n=1 Tax=Gadus morhua TaxID=8049 RepID=A0A8C4ZNM8_GADMO